MGFISKWTQTGNKRKQEDEAGCPHRNWQPVSLVETTSLCGLALRVCVFTVWVACFMIWTCTCKLHKQSICSDVCIFCQHTWMVFMFHLHKERLSERSELAANHVTQWHASQKCVEKTPLAWINVQLLNLVLCRWMVSNIFYLWTVASFWLGRKSSFSFSWRPECEKEVTEAWMWWQEAECVRRSRSGDYKRGFPLISLTDTLTFQQSRARWGLMWATWKWADSKKHLRAFDFWEVEEEKRKQTKA